MQITYASAAGIRPLSLYMGAAGAVSSRTLYAKRQRGNVFRKCFYCKHTMCQAVDYCLGKRALEGGLPVVKLLRHGLISRPPRRVKRA